MTILKRAAVIRQTIKQVEYRRNFNRNVFSWFTPNNRSSLGGSCSRKEKRFLNQRYLYVNGSDSFSNTFFQQNGYDTYAFSSVSRKLKFYTTSTKNFGSDKSDEEIDLTDKEKLMTSLLENSKKLASPKEIIVKDMSGGCGAMYNIYVASPSFKNLNMIKQHRLVQGILKEEIKEMHGLTIETKVI